jgi:6-phosphogluconolactonase
MAAKGLFFSCVVLMALAGAGKAVLGQTVGFAYVANGNSNNVSAYRIDGITGALTPVAGSPFPVGSAPSPYSVAVHPTGQFAYLASSSGNVSAYSIDGTTGALTAVSGSPFPAEVGSISVTVDPTGKFAYVANDSSSGHVSAFSIDGTTGALTPVPGSPFPAGSFPNSVTVDPTGKFAYVANAGSNNVSAYTIDGTTGVLAPVPGSPFPAADSPAWVTVDPTGRFAYVALPNSNNVSAYTIDATTGALTPIPGSPFSAVGPFSVAVDPTGRFAYVANRTFSGHVSAYTIDGTTGALTPIPGSPFPAGQDPNSVTVDPTGKFAYVANGGSNNVSAYIIDGTTGALTPVSGSPFPAGLFPQSVTATAGPPPIAAAFLGFPLRNKTAFSAAINTVFDHSMPQPYCPDGVIVAYTGEEGRSTIGHQSVFHVTFSYCGSLYGFQRDADGSPFDIGGQYGIGAQTDNDGTCCFLFYDGHAGYDYRTKDQLLDGTLCPDVTPLCSNGKTQVLAAAAGRVVCSNGCDGMFGEIRIDHGNGYFTSYLHLGDWYAAAGDPVTQGQVIGISGDTGVTGSPHLHFEVRQMIGGVLVPVDPYGWHPIQPRPDPYTRAVNVDLWQ